MLLLWIKLLARLLGVTGCMRYSRQLPDHVGVCICCVPSGTDSSVRVQAVSSCTGSIHLGTDPPVAKSVLYDKQAASSVWSAYLERLA